VPCTLDALRAAAARIDQGRGTVWAGDNRSGWHGGASFTRRVRDEGDAAGAAALLAAACDRARVMPFLDGIPCSVHGIVFPDFVAALRPCEMLVLNHADGSFQYASAATFWDPPQADRDQMRSHAKRVGEHLREWLGFRGVFTLDGVMTAEGFRPTELNPRYGAAIGVMALGIPRLPLYLLHLALVEGEPLDWRGEALEAAILAHADAHRDGRPGVVVPSVCAAAEVRVVLDAGAIREAAAGEPADATCAIGPAAAGSYVRVTLDPLRTPVGRSVAPRLADLLAWLDLRWGLGLGRLEPAREVRSGATEPS
jgi:hypothetical protein